MKDLDRLQSLQNIAVKLIFSAGKRDNLSLLWILNAGCPFGSVSNSRSACTSLNVSREVLWNILLTLFHINLNLLDYFHDHLLTLLFLLLMLETSHIRDKSFHLRPHCGTASQETSGRHEHCNLVSRRF